MVSHILLFMLGALHYTMLVFRFPSLHTLRQYQRNNVINRYNDKPLLFLYISIPHNNTTNVSNINVHLTVTVSLRVPPLLAYNISNPGVIMLLLYLDNYSFTPFIHF